MSLAYAFGDETWPAGTGYPWLRVAIILIEQEAFKRLHRQLDLRSLEAGIRDQTIFEGLTAAGARVCEGQLRLPPEELPGRAEVSGVAAPNLLLTSAIGWTLGRMLLGGALEETGFRTVDLHLDPLSLGPGLDDRFRSLLEQDLREIGRQFLRTKAAGSERHFPKLRRVSWVKKAPAGQSPTTFQFGTNLAHRYLALDSTQADSILGECLAVHDLSETFLDSYANLRAGKQQGVLAPLREGGGR